MLTNHVSRVSTIAALTLTLALPGCGAGDEPAEDAEVAAIADAIEQDNGGLTMTDEEPAFGDPVLMEEASSIEEAIVDPFAEDAEVVQMQQAPDAVVFHAVVMWGQFPFNPDLDQARSWSGALHLNRGAMLVNRTVAFEGPSDSLLPRPDAQTVTFSSVTRPHHDGLRLTIIDPEPLHSEPLTLTYLTPDGVVVSLPMAALVGGPVNEVVDDLENRVVAYAIPRPLDLCAQGMLGGNWWELAPGRGKFLGPVVDVDGDLIGHVRGIWGRRQNGQRVFFGKYINTQGHFMGIFAGHYGDEKFAGQWRHSSGEVGVLGGQYRDMLPGPDVGGHFLGGWAETSCNAPIGH